MQLMHVDLKSIEHNTKSIEHNTKSIYERENNFKK
mgnify:CR=1 FL=1